MMKIRYAAHAGAPPNQKAGRESFSAPLHKPSNCIVCYIPNGFKDNKRNQKIFIKKKNYDSYETPRGSAVEPGNTLPASPPRLNPAKAPCAAVVEPKAPVSYTQLDVYKRQRLLAALVVQQGIDGRPH